VITPANDRDPSPTSDPAHAPGTSVIDLREGPTTRVRVARDDNPFSAMAPAERMRLIIRVLCELVAYDELDAAKATEHRRTLQTTVAERDDRSRPTSITG
jgi:hypothetical protein